MNKTGFVFSIAVAALLVVTPAMGQLINAPVFGLAPGDADGSTAVGAGWAGGLNENSGKQHAFGVGVDHNREMFSVGVLGAYVASDTDEVTLALSAAYHLPIGDDGPVNVSIQSGIGWMSPELTGTLLQFPVGVVVSGSAESGSVTIPWWVMPRVNFLRTGDDGVLASSTATDFGGSGGIAVAMDNGWAVGVSGDLLIVDDPLVATDTVTRFLLSAGVSYALP